MTHCEPGSFWYWRRSDSGHPAEQICLIGAGRRRAVFDVEVDRAARREAGLAHSQAMVASPGYVALSKPRYLLSPLIALHSFARHTQE